MRRANVRPRAIRPDKAAIGAWRSGIAPRVNQAVELDVGQLMATAVTLVPGHVLLKERLHRLLARLGFPSHSNPPES